MTKQKDNPFQKKLFKKLTGIDPDAIQSTYEESMKTLRTAHDCLVLFIDEKVHNLLHVPDKPLPDGIPTEYASEHIIGCCVYHIVLYLTGKKYGFEKVKEIQGRNGL